MFTTKKTWVRCVLLQWQVLVLLLGVVSGGWAATTKTWVGGAVDTNWSTGANWNPSGAPGSGAALIFAGTSDLTNNNNIAAGTSFASITFSSSAGAFVLGGNQITLTGGITNSDTQLQTINLAVVIAATRTINAANGDITISGIISGAGGITKTGTGTLKLLGANTYVNDTAVNGGTLLINGSISGTSAVTVASGATLGGTGNINDAVTISAGGILAPGNGGTDNGNLDINNAVTFSGAGTLSLNLNYGSVNGESVDSTSTFTCTNGLLTIASIAGTPAAGKDFRIINAATVVGEFTGKSHGSVFTEQGRTFQISYSSDGVNLLDVTSVVSSTKTWDAGASNTNWGAAANWAGDVAPLSGDTLVFAGASKLTNNNNYVAGTSFAAITFDNTADAFVLGGNSITLAGSITNNDTQLQTINLAVAMAATRTIDAASGDITMGGVISGAGGLTKSGSGTLTLTQTNTYTGLTTVSAGTLRGTGSISTGGVTVSGGSIAGGTTSAKGTFTVNGAANISAGTVATRIAAYTTAGTDFDRVACTGALTLGGTSVLALDLTGLASTGTATGAVTCSGTPTGTFSSVTVSNNTNNYQVAVQYASGSVNVICTTAGARTLYWNPQGTSSDGNAALNWSTDQAGTTYVQALAATDTLRFNGSGANADNDCTLTANLTCAAIDFTGYASAGADTNTGTFTDADKTLTVNGSATFVSGMTFTATGALTIVGSGTLTFGGKTINNLTANTGTLTLSGVPSLTGTTTIAAAVAKGTNLMTVNTSGNSTISGVISGSGGLTKSGASTLTLSNTNSYTGLTTVSAGTLRGTGSISTGGVTVSGGTIAGGTTGAKGTFTVNGAANISAGSVTTRIAGYTTPGTDFDKVACTGALTLGGTSVLNLDLAGLSGTGTATGILTCSGTPVAFTTVNVSNNSNNYIVTVQYAAGSVNVVISANAGILYWHGATSNANLASNWRINQDGTSPASVINATDTLQFNGTGTNSDANCTLTAGLTCAAISFTDYTGTFNDAGFTLTVNGNANLVSGMTYTTTGGLTIGATGTLTSGTKTINNLTANTGTLTLGDALSLTGTTTLGAAVTNAGYLMTINNSGNVTISGAIAGSGGLTKSGSGTLSLTGTNTYTGTTTISAGTLSIGNGTTDGDIATSANIVNNATLTYNNTTAKTYANVISGTGSLIKLGAGTLTLTGTNTYAGSTTITAGTLRFDADADLSGTGGIVLNGGTLYHYKAANLPNALSVTGNSTLQSNDKEGITFSSNSISWTAGTLTLTRGGSGEAFVVTFSGNGFTYGGQIILDVATRLSFANTSGSQVFSGAITGSGKQDDDGALMRIGVGGTTTISNVNTYTRNTTISGGTLLVTGSTVAASLCRVTGTAGAATLGGSGTVSGTVTLSAGTTLAPGSGGTTIGTLNTGAVTCDATSIYSINIDGATCDRVTSTGAFACNGTLTIASVANPIAGTTYTIASGTSLSGTFTGLANNAQVSQAGRIFRINYTGTTATLLDGPAPILLTRQTIDFDEDGKIDRIRLTFDQALNDNTTNFAVTVAGYSVTGYASVITNDAAMDVEVTELGAGDTGATPAVQITAAGSLGSYISGTAVATEGSPTNATDTAKPVLMSAAWSDGDANGVDAGDTVTLTFSESVTCASMAVADLGLPVSNDSLSTTTIANQSGSTLTMTLAGTPQLSPGQTYSSAALVEGHPSGVFIANPTPITDAVGLTPVIGDATSARDLAGSNTLSIAWVSGPNPKSWGLGIVVLDAKANSTAALDLALSNVGDSTLNLSIAVANSAPSGWSPAATAGTDNYLLMADNAGLPAADPTDTAAYELTLGNTDQELYNTVLSGTNRDFELYLNLPTAITVGASVQQTITVTITAALPP